MHINGLTNLLRSGGESSALIQSVDWSSTSVGPPEGWPQSLQSALSICINSNFPIAIYWGPDLVLLYNDAWNTIPGTKHPWAFGKTAREVWPEIWNDILPQFEKAFSGIPGGSRDALLPMQRHGYTEECYFDFTFTPIYGESGKVEGIFNAVIETTYRVINERRATTLQRLADGINGLPSSYEILEAATSILTDAKADVPFFFIYEFHDGKTILKGSPPPFNLTISQALVDEVCKGDLVHVTDIKSVLDPVPTAHWPEPPSEAVLLPMNSNDGKTFGFILCGISARRKFDKEYRSFYGSLSSILTGELNTAASLVVERQRAEALAELDRSKTIFFNNISHEFRTPLTLMLGPIQEVLQDPSGLKPEHLSNLQLSHKNTLRLQKLVNALLDFSRIESGKLEARFAKVNIGRLTEDFASSFRSAVEHGGLKYVINIENKTKLVTIDTDMWEKIVLNLISNAFKYTDHGRIEVRLFESNNHLNLTVSDTGVGIPPEELPKIFERFYRANNASGRSQEGTGIGLSMVRELVHLLKGAIKVDSAVGKGSVFTVSIPIHENLQSAEEGSKEEGPSSIRTAFIEEAMDWVAHGELPEGKTAHHDKKKSKVLVADDNGDMREYIYRLLSGEFDILMAADGEDAQQRAINDLPDLILSDVMMPKLDGFGLLKTIRSNFSTRNIPFIFLSARAGEEAKVDGIHAGADDYLVKPFSSRELIARVTNQINISKARRESEKQFFNLFLQSPAHIHVMRGPEHIFEFFHPLGKAFTGGRDFTGMKVREALPEIEGQGYFEMLDQVYRDGKSFNIPESKAYLKNDKGELTEYYFHITYLPWRGVDEKILGVLQFSFDVTEQAKARFTLQEAEGKLQNAIELAELGTWHIDLQTNFVSYDQRIVDWWGLDAKGASLETVINCIIPEDRQKVSDAVNHALTVSGVYNADYRLANNITGEVRHIAAKGKVFHDSDKKPIRLSGIARDITLQTMAQQELERLVKQRTKELNEANTDLRRSNEDLQQFAYVASHDLQEPLRKIQTFSELASSKLEDVKASRAYLEKIDTSAARMTSLIKDVLAYSQASQKDTESSPIDLNEIIEHVKSDFELTIQQKNVRLLVGKMPVIKGSRHQFNQLFNNLIGNAIKFSSDEPVIEVNARVVTTIPARLSVKPSREYHELTIKDNGIGFDPEYSERIFQLFSRLHNRAQYNGTGIGLALCKKIVENHHGAILATSEKAKGATFTIYLPVN